MVLPSGLMATAWTVLIPCISSLAFSLPVSTSHITVYICLIIYLYIQEDNSSDHLGNDQRQKSGRSVLAGTGLVFEEPVTGEREVGDWHQ